MAKRADTNAARYAQLCREAAKQLGAKLGDSQVEHVATLRLARETLAAKLIAGETVDPTALLKFDEALRAYQPPPVPLKLELAIVERALDYTCKHCGQRNELGAGEYTPAPEPMPSRPRYSQTIDAEVVKPTAAKPKALPPPAPAEKEHPAGIHSAPGARTVRYDYSGIAPTDGYDPFQPAPQWDKGHPLPEPPWGWK